MKDVCPCYVITDHDQILVQLPDTNKWGFTLVNEDQTWPGGWGIDRWERLSDDDPRIRDEDRKRLQWIFDELPLEEEH